MLLKITDFPDDLADQLKARFASSTASKAVLAAASSYLSVSASLDSALEAVEARDLEIRRLRSIIEGARSAAALLLERTGQTDLLSESEN